MKKIILATALFASVSSFAAEVNFTYFGNEGGRQSYYACSYVEDQAISYLELLGATNIDVRCSGGIQTGSWYAQPVSLRAKFDLPVVTGANVETVEIEGDNWNPACGLNTRMLNEMLKKFENVTVLKKIDSCAFATTNYYYKLQISR
jgi:hypothetical protein